MIYVSMTGFRPKGALQVPRFWWRTLWSLSQARRAPGNLLTTARRVDGVYHTMTAWSDLASMRAYVGTGAHLKAMRGFRALGSGRVFGYTCAALPDWDSVYAQWQRYGREV